MTDRFECDSRVVARPSAGQIQARYLRGFATLVRQRGADPRPILERFDIDPDALHDPNHSLSCYNMASMLEYGSGSLNDPIFGIHLAEHQGPNVFGSVAVLAQAAPNFLSALQVLVDYLPVLHSPEGELRFDCATKTLEIRWSSTGYLNAMPQSNCQGCLLQLKTLLSLSSRKWAPRYVAFAFDGSRTLMNALGERLGCRVHRSAENIIGLPADIADDAVPSADGLVFSVLGQFLSATKKQTKPTLREKVENYVRKALPARRCTIEDCAARIGLSVRPLQKRLAAMGTSFSTIVQNETMSLAKQALEATDESLDDIAISLGYSDQTCFGRAFKRWTGMTPQAYRSSRGLQGKSP